jgi:hypothetical protein
VVTASHGAISVYYEQYVRGHSGFWWSREIRTRFLIGPLEEIDIGDGITPQQIFVNKNMTLEHKDAVIKLLRDCVDFSPGITMKCPVLAEG